jgi:hypothetical protein
MNFGVLHSGTGNTAANLLNTLRIKGGACTANGGARFGVSGNPGVVVMYYPGTAKASGGTITTTSGITYHTFTSPGTFST